MKQICLTQGLVAHVDDCDFESLNAFKWYANKDGNTYYAQRKEKVDGKWKTVAMHRQLLDLVRGDGKVIDHISHNGLDNQRENLRICTHGNNLRNQQIQTRIKSSNFKGVYRNRARNKWRARIKINRKYIYLGDFTSEIEAAKAYDVAALKHFGEFAFTNFPK